MNPTAPTAEKTAVVRQGDPRVAAIRADKIVGRNTCSVIDECYTDAELAAHLDGRGIR